MATPTFFGIAPARFPIVEARLAVPRQVLCNDRLPNRNSPSAANVPVVTTPMHLGCGPHFLGVAIKHRLREEVDLEKEVEHDTKHNE